MNRATTLLRKRAPLGLNRIMAALPALFAAKGTALARWSLVPRVLLACAVLALGLLLLDGGVAQAAPPEPRGSIEDKRWAVTEGDLAFYVASYFRDRDGDTLTYTATVADTEVATVSVVDSELTVTPVACCKTTVTVTAADPGGDTAQQTFTLRIIDYSLSPVVDLGDSFSIRIIEGTLYNSRGEDHTLTCPKSVGESDGVLECTYTSVAVEGRGNRIYFAIGFKNLDFHTPGRTPLLATVRPASAPVVGEDVNFERHPRFSPQHDRETLFIYAMTFPNDLAESFTVKFPITNDSRVEEDEYFRVYLGNTEPYERGDLSDDDIKIPWMEVLIRDDDVAAPENAPTGLAADEVTATSVRMNWDAVAGAHSYRWSLRLGNHLRTATEVASGTTTGTELRATGLASQQFYTAYVSTCFDAAQSNCSDPVAGVVNTATPAPTNLVVSEVRPHSARLEWTPYARGPRDRESFFNIITIDGRTIPVGETGTFLEVAGLTPATTYSWQVQSCHYAPSEVLNGRALEPEFPLTPIGRSLVVCSGAESTFETLDWVPPATPTGLAAAPGNGTVALSWTDPDDITITGYEYRVSADDGVNWNPNWTDIPNSAPGEANATSYAVTGLSNGAEYTFEVRAVNDAGTGNAASITATPVNLVNEAPTFTGSGSFSVAENTTDVGTVTATDSDAEDDVTGYEITGGADRGKFSIDASAGDLTFDNAPDFEDPDSDDGTNAYIVQVTASSGGSGREMTASQTITVTVINAEEAGTVTLSTGSPGVGAALTARLTDPDGNISGLSWQWAWSADGSTGWADITGATSASYTPVAADVDRYLRATASYTDGQGPGKNQSAVSTNPVAATPPVNTAPTFDDGATATRSVAENTATDTNIGDPVSATDAESDTLTYSLQVDDDPNTTEDADAFDIDAATGQLKTREPLDHETQASYTVTVQVTDGNPDATIDGAIEVTVTVTNVEEAGTVTLSTDRPRVNSVITASLTDPDGAVSGLSWQWAKSADGSTGWSDITGATSAGYTPVADDLDSYLRATASYADGHGPDKSQAAATANSVAAATPTGRAPIGRAPIGRAPTFVDGASATRTVAENSSGGTAVGAAITATDADGDTLTYSLSGSDAASFEIDSSAGQIKVGSDTFLDFEVKDSYTVEVQVTDGKATDGSSDSAIDATISVAIAVTDVDEPPGAPDAPMVAPAETDGHNALVVSWNEPTAPSGTTPPAITAYDVRHIASDADATINDNWTEVGNAWETGDGPLAYQIGGLSAGTAYGVQVRAENSEGASDWSTATTGTTNAQPQTGAGNSLPSFTTNANFTVPENQTSVGTVAANDPDADDSVTGYEISGGADRDRFNLDGSDPSSATFGQLAFRDAPDFEDPGSAAGDNEYVVAVAASSGGEGRELSASQTITVTVTNAEESGVVALSNASPRVGATIQATLSDPDGSVTEASWQWQRSNAGSDWTGISSATNAGYRAVSDDQGWQLRAAVQYNDGHGSGKMAESPATNPVLPLLSNRLSSGSSGGRMAPLNWAPEFVDGESTSRRVSENSPLGHSVGDPVSASDPDRMDTLTYTLSGDDAFAFAINGESGQITVASALDYETGSSYSVVVIARDSRGALDRITVTINVENVDEPAALSLSPELAEIGTEIVATLADPDGGVSEVQWQWQSSADGTTWVVILGETAPAFLPVFAHAGSQLRVIVAYDDIFGPGKTVVSAATPPILPAMAHDPTVVGAMTVKAAAGELVQFDPTGPTNPARVEVQTPNAGYVTMITRADEGGHAPAGFNLVGFALDIKAPPASALDPIKLRFEVVTQEPADAVAVFKDGVLAEGCTGDPGQAESDPCVSAPIAGDGVVVITALSSGAGIWRFGVAEGEPTPPTADSPMPEPTETPTPGPTETPTPPPTPAPTETPTPLPTLAPEVPPTQLLVESLPRPAETSAVAADEEDVGDGGFPLWAIVVIVVGAVGIAGGSLLVLRVRNR